MNVPLLNGIFVSLRHHDDGLCYDLTRGALDARHSLKAFRTVGPIRIRRTSRIPASQISPRGKTQEVPLLLLESLIHSLACEMAGSVSILPSNAALSFVICLGAPIGT